MVPVYLCFLPASFRAFLDATGVGFDSQNLVQFRVVPSVIIIRCKPRTLEPFTLR